MMTALFYLLALGVVAAAAWFAWHQFGPGGGVLFGSARESRIGVSEVVTIDGKRKLVLVHRDGVEHLIMTGGPIDVVIEQNIMPLRRSMAAPAPQPVQAPNLEPRYVASPASPVTEASGSEAPGNFGRLRQRAPQLAAETHSRSDGTGTAGGSR